MLYEIKLFVVVYIMWTWLFTEVSVLTFVNCHTCTLT